MRGQRGCQEGGFAERGETQGRDEVQGRQRFSYSMTLSKSHHESSAFLAGTPSMSSSMSRSRREPPEMRLEVATIHLP